MKATSPLTMVKCSRMRKTFKYIKAASPFTMIHVCTTLGISSAIELTDYGFSYFKQWCVNYRHCCIKLLNSRLYRRFSIHGKLCQLLALLSIGLLFVRGLGDRERVIMLHGSSEQRKSVINLIYCCESLCEFIENL